MLFLIVVNILMRINECRGSGDTIWKKEVKNMRDSETTILEPANISIGVTNLNHDREKYDLTGETFSLVNYEDTFFQFCNDDEDITGVIGELWKILQDYLNFTMIMTKSEDVLEMGTPQQNYSNWTGLIGMIERGEYMAIPYVEMYQRRYNVMDFTVPFWTDRYRLYAKPPNEYEKTWLINLFSRKVWYSIIAMSAISIFLITRIMGISTYPRHASPDGLFYSQYVFYYFGALCNQGSELYRALRDHRIMSVSVAWFSWFLLSSYTSYTYVFMTRVERIKPFQDLESLLQDTDYTVVIQKGSPAFSHFELRDDPVIRRISDTNRSLYLKDYRSLWDSACSNEGRYVALQYVYGPRMDVPCQLEAIGKSYCNVWVGVGLQKNLRLRQPINYSIIKLRESGIIDYMKKKWFDLRIPAQKDMAFSPISLDRVFLLGYIYFSGLISSTIILIFEKLYQAWLESKSRT